MNRIKELDSGTIEKIAAGEVVERPSSIVKELLENSIDAGSRNIVIEIKNGGKSLIRVTDDGSGIVKKDLALAFKRHSTSKLSKIDDLYQIRSLGFRGEALASISAVARVKVMTKTQDSLAGVEADIVEGELVDLRSVGSPQGTTMIVRDLFYNLPVRRDFLKSDLAEANRISDIVYKLALGNPQIGFSYIKDDSVVLRTQAGADLSQHIYSVLGREISENIIGLDHEGEDISIRGYISNNKYYRGNRSHQYLYINNRIISNMAIAKNIEAQYRSLIPVNRFPIFVLFIDIDPGRIDVNIHPSKQEVKFTREEEIHQLIAGLVARALRPSLEVPTMSISREKKPRTEALPTLFDLAEDQPRQEDEDLTKAIVVEDFRQEARGEEAGPLNPEVREAGPVESREYLGQEILEEDYEARKILENLEPLTIVFNTYIIAQEPGEDRIYFIDQHAAHERVMYEKYLREFSQEAVVSQTLMAGEPIELTVQEMNNVLANMELFKQLGFDLEIFGQTSIIIRALPLVFGRPDIKSLFFDILDNLDLDPRTNYDSRLDKIMKLACVKSVKSGDELAREEVLALFESLKKCSQPHTCPHGRPTILEMTRKHIEKEFLRII